MIVTSLRNHLEDLHRQFQAERSGQMADYIPELTKANPEWFGIAVVTVDGQVYQAGDTREPFTMQSISKPFVYGMALEDRGPQEVASRIDVEPSGEAFNSISLESDTGRPRNPMINAGAIAATSLVEEQEIGGRMGRILDTFARYTGHPLEVDQAVYASESRTGHRNRAISHLLRNYEILREDPEPILDAYFQQCSIRVTCRDLALMGATLANNGVNPITGVRALRLEYVPMVLSVMASCGMYDYSGNWIHSVGMPAKSGVGGGIVAVLPGQFSLAVFSPLLDPKGNSVRGIRVCEAISHHFGLHMLRTTRMTSATVIRNRYTLAQISSKLHRPPMDFGLLKERGEAAEILELTGDLMFVTMEMVIVRISEDLEKRRFVILDMRRVTSIDDSAAKMIDELAQSMMSQGKLLFLTGHDNLHGFVTYLRRFNRQLHGDQTLVHKTLDQAMEWCETKLLKAAHRDGIEPTRAELKDQLLCADFSEAERSFLEALMTRETAASGDVICREGEPADRMFFIESGQVSTWIRLTGTQRYRVFGSCPGWPFGESALFGNHTRTADVIADTPVTLLCLQPRDLESNPDPLATQVRLKIFRNLAQLNQYRLKESNREIRILTV